MKGPSRPLAAFPFLVHTLAALLVAATLPAGRAAAASHQSVLKEYERVFPTYPYSDPDPVPAMTRYYPYFHYDGYADKAAPRSWKVVELSNDYLQVLILPEIGGKIWTAIDKTTGKAFIYFNPVVKFRDVSMRGPWTSGGIEANYGIMGHTPNCFSPVDYLARRNPDGSASCFIGALDLLTRTSWRLEIVLPPDAACFSTRSFWHNGSGLDQPYYTWMNAGIKSAGNLELISPGAHYLGHDGRAFAWPINPDNGRNISWYEQNNFGSYKSYHVYGRLAEFFGGYWHDEDFGMAHCAPYGDKPGRKFWIWGLSREGMIWEDLLTDGAGQYVEVQSGRFFNQADDSSSRSPFKHHEFPAYSTDTWTEHWLPVKGTKGFVSASPWGALNVTVETNRPVAAGETNRLIVRICPARPLRDKLKVYVNGGIVYASSQVVLRPMQPYELIVPFYYPLHSFGVMVGRDKLQYASEDSDVLSRPLAAPADFDWNSLYGLYLKAQESVRQRLYVRAAGEFQACLKRDPNFPPALVGEAELAVRRGDWEVALDFARRVLAIDAYDGGANYQFGLASAALGGAASSPPGSGLGIPPKTHGQDARATSALQHQADAKAAFAIAALSPAWRGAAGTELAKEYLREGLYDRALASAAESLEVNTGNLAAFQVRACIARLRGDRAGAEAAIKALLALDPLNHFARCERFLAGRATRKEFAGLIRNELPHETFLELAAWYRSVGLDEDAARVLAVAPPAAEVLYWLAYLQDDPSTRARAEAASPDLVFPFRVESVPVFTWAAEQSRAWQPKYYLALVRWHHGELAKAHDLFAACGDEPRFAPFYAARARLAQEWLGHPAQEPSPGRPGPDSIKRDLERAGQLDPAQWRYGVLLAKLHSDRGDLPAALATAADYARRFPTNSALAVLHAKTLLQSGRLEAAAQLLDSLHVLPSEGSTEARGLFHEAHLLLALERFQARQFDDALRETETGRQWPERLGSGKPYAEDTDERVEDWLAYQCHRALAHTDQAQQLLEKALAFRPQAKPRGAGAIVRALALKETGQTAKAERLLQDWLAQDPQNDTARWALDLLAGRKAPPPAPSGELALRVLAGTVEGDAR